MNFSRYTRPIIFLVVCASLFFYYQLKPSETAEKPRDHENSRMEQAQSNTCEPKNFWEKYDIWGDTSTLYRPADKADKKEPANETNENAGCDDSKTGN
ncbi:MAG: hypothetical protein R3E62_09310 [Pseudomonadales bacterium]